MDAQGVDVQVVSIHTPFFGYHLDAAQGLALAREVNDEIAGMARHWPTRFAGLATLPVQDVAASIDELERAVNVLGLKGVELDTVVGSEKALRYLLDEVGADRVVLGSDWPFVPWHPSPVTWLQGMKTVTEDEKEKILWRNLEALLRLES